MRRHSAAVAVAAGALILAVNIKSTGQAPADVTTRTASARPAVAKSQAKTERAAPKPSAKSPAKAGPPRRRGVYGRHQVALRRDLQRVSQLDRPRGRTRREPLHVGGVARRRARPLGSDSDQAQVAGDASRGRAPAGPGDQHPGEVPRDGVRQGRRRHEARSGAGDRAPFEPGRVHEHDPGSPRHRVSRRQELSDRRFGRRLRQHR